MPHFIAVELLAAKKTASKFDKNYIVKMGLTTSSCEVKGEHVNIIKFVACEIRLINCSSIIKKQICLEVIWEEVQIFCCISYL
jgi:hypothetical protein